MVIYMALLEITGLRKIYKSKQQGAVTEALKDIHFSVEKGEFVAIMGESGSGKTTLLNILAMFDRPTEGQVLLQGRSLAQVGDSEISAFRRKALGYVFQDFNLLDTFSVQDNVLLPLVLAGRSHRDMEEALAGVASQLGIEGLLKKYPYEISGGQKQRAAIARALITEPDLILADEPTGNLDSNSSEEMLKNFEQIHQRGQTILMVTHSARAAACAGRVLFIKDGRIFHQLHRGGRSREDMYEEIWKSLTMLAG